MNCPHSSSCNSIPPEEDVKPIIYHEKQKRELCALHTLNNLMQIPNFFNKDYLDSIVKSLHEEEKLNVSSYRHFLSFAGNHTSLIGWLGNYDINVIMLALQSRGYECIWFDKRKNLQEINFDAVFGLILNQPSDYPWLGPLNLPVLHGRRHWICIRRIGPTTFYNLDSKLNEPQIIGDVNALLKYLTTKLQISYANNNNKYNVTHMLIVANKDTPAYTVWKH